MSEVAVITGATRGIGRVTARELARAGRSVVLLCRNPDAGEAVAQEIRSEVPGARLSVLTCDLARLDSVRACAQRLRACAPIALLVNNAGMVSLSRQRSADGFELTFATNHLGPFLLTALLIGQLKTGARIVTVASRAHFQARELRLDDVAAVRARYWSAAAYARSKLANVMHTFALARRLTQRRIAVNCLHPGVVATHLLPAWVRLVKPLMLTPVLDVERGARTTLHLALAPGLGSSGCYFDENQSVCPASGLARDVSEQERLWAASERWVGGRHET